MLARKFGQAVSWWFDLDAHYERGLRWGNKLDGFLQRSFGGEQRDAVANIRLRHQLVHDQAARAVEWNWDKPQQMREFIQKETPPGGYLWGVTPDEILQYSQQHFRELLPRRSDPASQAELEALRERTLEPG